MSMSGRIDIYEQSRYSYKESNGMVGMVGEGGPEDSITIH
jgi:hypothetical protein